MAVTNIHSIKQGTYNAIAYICNPDKTANGKYVISNLCVPTPQGASKQFAETRIGIGRGKARTECQHIIQSFAPNEVTPEQAILIGQELCKRLFDNEYQYVLATHTNTDCIHNHIIVNNVNFFTGKTFETEHNQGKIPERAWAKLLNASDELCKENSLSVIDDHTSTKGKSHFEWEVDKINKSWKSKLKYAIDQVVKVSEDFDDFLRKCEDFGIIVEYNPEHKIDLKFMLIEQKENNPRAKMTRAKTLGWLYESRQIAKRIENYKKYMRNKPDTTIIKTSSDKFLDSPALEAWADRENMKAASKAINEMTASNSTLEELEKAARQTMAKFIASSAPINKMSSRINELQEQIPLVEKYYKYKDIYKEYKSLEGRAKKKYKSKFCYEIDEYTEAGHKMLSHFPDGKVPKLKDLQDELYKLQADYQKLSAERKEYKKESDRLCKAAQKMRDSQRTLRRYIENEQQTADRRNNRDGLE